MIARILAGVTVAVAALLAWGPAAPSHPGEGVPASVADSLRGGDCFATVETVTCENVAGRTCTTNTNCTAQNVLIFSGVSATGSTPDGDLVCCGTSGSCFAYNPKKKTCGQG